MTFREVIDAHMDDPEFRQEWELIKPEVEAVLRRREPADCPGIEMVGEPSGFEGAISQDEIEKLLRGELP